MWEVVTSLENYAWRSDLSKIEIINENQFIEYTKEGYATTFTITGKELYKRWEFDMEKTAGVIYFGFAKGIILVNFTV